MLWSAWLHFLLRSPTPKSPFLWLCQELQLRFVSSSPLHLQLSSKIKTFFYIFLLFWLCGPLEWQNPQEGKLFFRGSFYCVWSEYTLSWKKEDPTPKKKKKKNKQTKKANKKSVFIFQMYIWCHFVLFHFKNYIIQMFAVIVNTLIKTFAKVGNNSTDHFTWIGNNFVSVLTK